MKISLINTLKSIENNLVVEATNSEKLKKAYNQTLKLRSQLLSVIYDTEMFMSSTMESPDNIFLDCANGKVNKQTVLLTINEPLPLLKELTAITEEHWIELLNLATKQVMQEERIYFQKAFVEIEVITPRGTDNSKLWDTSNRAINVIINNLKGIYFPDDNFEHMAFSVVGRWGNTGQTIIKIWDFNSLKH